MSVALAVFLLFSTFQTAPAQGAREHWFSQDKVLHLSLSTALVGTLYHLHQHKCGESRRSSQVFATQVTLYLCIGKEMKDRHFSYKDLMVDLVGIGLGLLLFVK